MKNFIEYTDIHYIKDITSKNKFDAIEELARVFEGSDVCSDVDELVRALKEREEIMTTGIGFGIAVPHAKIRAVNKIAFAIGISRKGIEFDSIDGNPVNLIILVAAGERQHKEYLKLLSQIMGLLRDENIRKQVIGAKKPEKILEIMNNK
ncbi:MAG TPA: PTS sugar transporter subunit IIA [Spirochaetota bacterium]|nr:PTS sugar transporter subunit IIA [Spirochaetota bacterium]